MKMKKIVAHLIVILLVCLAYTASAAPAAFIQGGQSCFRSTSANRVQEDKVPLFFTWGRRRRPTRGAQEQSHSSKDDSRLSFIAMTTSSSSSDPSSVNLNDDDDELDDERKANLFQFLLRDLQVEGVPLLSIDAAAGNKNVQGGRIGVQAILQAALWTTMAELIQDEMENKVCLVLEDFALEDLRTLVDDFTAFKMQNGHVDSKKNILPELERVSLSLVGKGKVGPAMILEVSNATETTTTPKAIGNTINDNEMAYTASMKAFSSRLSEKTDIYPYQQPYGGNTAYRFCGYSDACHILSSFWNCICELTATSADDIGSTVLVLPGLSNDESSSNTDDKDAPLAARFAAMTRLMSRTLCLFGGDETFKLAYFSPTYNRDDISPSDKLVHGHLLPHSWIRSVLLQHDCNNDNAHGADANINIDDLDSSLLEQTWDYQRRAPVAAVVIKRASLLQDENEKDDELPSNDEVAAYARNAMFLARQGKESLQTALESEMAIYKK